MNQKDNNSIRPCPDTGKGRAGGEIRVDDIVEPNRFHKPILEVDRDDTPRST